MKSFENVNLEGIIWGGVPISIFIIMLFFFKLFKIFDLSSYSFMLLKLNIRSLLTHKRYVNYF